MERIEAIADDLKYILLCQQQNAEEGKELARSAFKPCETKEELQTLNESLDDPNIFQSTVSFFRIVIFLKSCITVKKYLF